MNNKKQYVYKNKTKHFLRKQFYRSLKGYYRRCSLNLTLDNVDLVYFDLY